MGTVALDTQLLLALNSLAGRSPALDLFIRFCGDYLAYLLGAAFIVLVFLYYPARQKWNLLLMGLGAGIIARYGVDEVIRFFWHRPRPYAALPVHNLFTDTSWSFPSGHASFFFALSTVLYMHNRRWGTWFYVLSAIVVLGRVAAGVHYPSDIIGGAVVGVLTGYATVLLTRFFLKKA